MLTRARRRTDVEWFEGDAASACRWAGEFELAVMTGHAFQVLLTDDEAREALAAIRAALRPGGRFAFETRNPLVRAWERWTPEHPIEAVDADGAVVREVHQVDLPVRGEYVSFTTTATHSSWPRPLSSRSTLRFLGPDRLGVLLDEAGFDVEAGYGDWDRSPLSATAPEIITIARRRG